MSSSLYEIKGFPELVQKLKSLKNDKVKKRELEKLLGQVANPTIKAIKALVPIGADEIFLRGKAYRRKKRQIGKRVYKAPYIGGEGRNSIGKKSFRKTPNAVVYVSPRSRKHADGVHLRQFIIRGTKYQKANPFIDKAFQQTKGRVTKTAEAKVARYIQKQIKKLSNA